MDAPGEKLLTKLWESLVDKGIGSLLKPWQLRREGRAAIDVRREEMLALAQAEREVEAIRRGEKSLNSEHQLIALPAPEKLQLPSTAAPDQPVAPEYVEEVAKRNMKAEAMRQELSLAKAVLHAEEELRNDPAEATAGSISDDWLFRWRDSAGRVSSEALQSLWGKVLAGEVKSPGRYSLRTLEFLRNLSQDEARAIERISPFVVHGVVFRGNDSLLSSEGITFGDLLSMQELGVLAGVESLGLQMSWPSSSTTNYQKVLLCHDRLLLISGPDPAKTVALNVCNVTTIGKQILQLGNFRANEKMLLAMGQAIKALGFDVQIGNFTLLSNSQLNAFDLKPV